jgi:acetylornithine/N-succinyldiaminopimelate aminotransferase
MKNILVTTGHNLNYSNIVKADNCSLYDSDGNRFLDLESGVWCTSVGHCNPRIHKILTEQSSKIIHNGYCYLNPGMDESAEKILGITGIKKGKCVFLCSGSEAVEFSVKMVKSFTDKPYFLTLKQSFLSAYGISGEKSKDNWVLFDWMNGDKIESIDFKKISAFVFEPGSSGGTVHFPPKEMIGTIISKVRINGGIIIANEVTTGIGRTGEWFGYNHFDFTPDIAAIGKGLGNGYPVSCAVIAENVVNKIDLNLFHYGQSHQNDALGAAIAGEVIDIIENDKLIEKCKVNGEYIRNALNAMKDKYGIIKEVRGKGLMIAIEFEKSSAGSFAEQINGELLKRRIILVKRPGFEVFRVDPALTIEQFDIDYFLRNLGEIIVEIKKREDARKNRSVPKA